LIRKQPDISSPPLKIVKFGDVVDVFLDPNNSGGSFYRLSDGEGYVEKNLPDPMSWEVVSVCKYEAGQAAVSDSSAIATFEIKNLIFIVNVEDHNSDIFYTNGCYSCIYSYEDGKYYFLNDCINRKSANLVIVVDADDTNSTEATFTWTLASFRITDQQHLNLCATFLSGKVARARDGFQVVLNNSESLCDISIEVSADSFSPKVYLNGIIKVQELLKTLYAEEVVVSSDVSIPANIDEYYDLRNNLRFRHLNIAAIYFSKQVLLSFF
jgi:hypothetical protein